jgi:hypothetical protein
VQRIWYFFNSLSQLQFQKQQDFPLELWNYSAVKFVLWHVASPLAERDFLLLRHLKKSTLKRLSTCSSDLYYKYLHRSSVNCYVCVYRVDHKSHADGQTKAPRTNMVGSSGNALDLYLGRENVHVVRVTLFSQISPYEHQHIAWNEATTASLWILSYQLFTVTLPFNVKLCELLTPSWNKTRIGK